MCFFNGWVNILVMDTLIHDQEGAITSDAFAEVCDRFCIRLSLTGTGAHTSTGLVERHIAITKLTAYKLWADCQQQGLQVTKEFIRSL